MPNYEKMYHKAFNALTDAEKRIAEASAIIHNAQQECEDYSSKTTTKNP